MLTFEEYKEKRDSLQTWINDISNELNAYPKQANGLVLKEVRENPLYQYKKDLYNRVFQDLRTLNGNYTKIYKKELAQERKARFDPVTGKRK